MDGEELRPGLWRWTAPHPEWTPEEGGPTGWDEEVGCVLCIAQDAIVLIDPLVPSGEPDRFWAALDRDVEQWARPVHVLLTVSWHERSAQAMVDRYGGRLWAHERVLQAEGSFGARVTDPFRDGAALPGGVEAFDASRSDEVVYWLPEHGALVPGDVLLGGGGGDLRLCPESWLPAGVGYPQLQAALRPLLDRPIELVLVSHGEPVLEGGRDALARALDQAPSAA
ncbi:MAG: hypothetical protein ACRDN6_07745 [Gaiellaceae bacterium]